MAESQVLAAFLGGLASYFTPCVYPLIPVVISYSCGAGSSLRTAFYSSFLYVLGLAVTMVMAGVDPSICRKRSLLCLLWTDRSIYYRFTIDRLMMDACQAKLLEKRE